MASSLASEDNSGALERGRARYQAKDYKGALEAFTKAVDESSDYILLNALDHRAAALEKLNRLQPALRDAKRMIDLKSGVSKGYLRCGKILQLKGENALALKIYERGLLKVKIGADEQRAILQKMYNKLHLAQNPGKILDPLQFLPLEVALMVCQYLNTRDRVICLAVSKGWKKVLESLHDLWMKLDTTTTRKAIGMPSLKAYLRRSNYNLNHAIISSKAGFDAPKLLFLTKTCKSLKILDMRGSGPLSNSLATALPLAQQLQKLTTSANLEMTASGVNYALKTCPTTLIHASFLNVCGGTIMTEFGNLRGLQRLEIGGSKYIFLDLFALQSATPNLVDLRLYRLEPRPANVIIDLQPWKRLEHLTLDNANLHSLPLLPPSLKHVYLDRNAGMYVPETDDGGFYLPLLETLSIQQCLGVTAQGISDIVRQSNKVGNYKRLDVSGRFSNETSVITDQFTSSTSLETLGLGRMRLKDKDIMSIIDLYPNLKHVNLESTSVTGVGLKYIVNKGITSINVDQCESLGEDAVVWARSMGVEVQHNMIRLQPKQRYRDSIADRYS